MGWCVGCGGRVTCIGWCRRLGQLLRPGVFATGAVRAEDSCGRPVRAGGLGWPGQADGTKGDPGATGSRGQRSACGSGGERSVIQCYHASPRHAGPNPSPLHEGRIDIDTTGKSTSHLHCRAVGLTFTLHEGRFLIYASRSAKIRWLDLNLVIGGFMGCLTQTFPFYVWPSHSVHP